MKDGPFHVVAHSYNDEHVTYAIYCNNLPFLVPNAKKGMVLKRRTAHAVCGLLNYVPGFWLEEPMSRNELLAAGR